MLLTNFLLALLPLTVAAVEPKAELSRSRARNLLQRDNSLAKRQVYSGTATFYDVGLGACGGYNVASDHIVALNTAQYGGGYPGPNCGRSITISYNGRQVGASIQDQCPTCGYGSLDLSRGLFSALGGTEDMGIFQMTWWYNDGNSQPQEPTTTKQPEPTSTYTPPTSTYTPPPETSTTPTSTYVAPSSTAPASSAAVSSITSIASNFDASASAIPSIVTNGTVLPFVNTSEQPSATGSLADAPVASQIAQGGQVGNLVMINQVVANYGNIIVTGAGES